MEMIFLKKNIKQFLYICFFLTLLIFQSDNQLAKSLTMDNSKADIVYEQLRLEIPKD